jgi:hypothetical protein
MNRSIAILVLLAAIAAVPARAADPAETPAPVRQQRTTAPTGPPQPPPPEELHVDRDALLAQSQQLLQEQQRLFLQRAMIPPPEPRPPAPPVWLLPLLISACALSLVSAAMQPFLHKRSSTASRARSQGVEGKIDAGLRHLGEQNQKANTDTVKTIDAAHDATMERITALFREVGDVKEHLARIADLAAEPAGGDAVRLEHEVLAEHWKVFRDKKGVQQTQENPWDNLLSELPAFVPTELQPSLDAVLTPYREHRFFIQKIGIIPGVVSGQMRLASEAAELKRARDLTQLLIAAQNDGHGRLEFPFPSWVTDTFLPFADLYLQNYQKARLEKRDGDLQKGMSLVREILRMVAVEPIDVTLGETRFDSARHIGRFTSSDPHFADGVITGVVRNGFVESGRQVIRQPEVVVNRVR